MALLVDTAVFISLERQGRSLEGLLAAYEGESIGLAAFTASELLAGIREVLSEADWQTYGDMEQMWAEEERTWDVRDASLRAEFLTSRRLKTPARGWFACVEDVPRAFFSSWPGDNGVGIVEDLYTQQDFRHRGLATALISRCVADARARGAGPVIIGSDPNDTPKLMYAAMGFRPLFVSRNYLRLARPHS